MDYPWHLYIMSSFYIIAGIMHFIKPKIYLRIMPHYLPKHKFLVYFSGVLEIVLGIAICISFLKNLALIAIIGLLFAFLTVHFYMLNNKKAASGLPKWLLVLRIPIQFVLMYWAYSYIEL